MSIINGPANWREWCLFLSCDKRFFKPFYIPNPTIFIVDTFHWDTYIIFHRSEFLSKWHNFKPRRSNNKIKSDLVVALVVGISALFLSAMHPYLICFMRKCLHTLCLCRYEPLQLYHLSTSNLLVQVQLVVIRTMLLPIFHLKFLASRHAQFSNILAPMRINFLPDFGMK